MEKKKIFLFFSSHSLSLLHANGKKKLPLPPCVLLPLSTRLSSLSLYSSATMEKERFSSK